VAGDRKIEDDVPQVLAVEAAGVLLPLEEEPRQDVLFLGLPQRNVAVSDPFICVSMHAS
jgi:hypothetical protein